MASPVDAQPPKHLSSLYTSFKGYLPQTQNYKILDTLDNTFTQVISTCDNLLTTTINSVKTIAEKVPTPTEVRTFVADKSYKELEILEKRLDSVVVFLGGKRKEVSEETKDILDKLLVILGRVYEANLLVVKNTYNRAVGYITSPTTLISDGNQWIHTVYIELAAIQITLKKLVVENTKYILNKLNAQYKETSNKITLFINDLKNPEKATEMVSERFFWLKRITVNAVKSGIEIIIDKKHYYDNLQKFVSYVVRVIGDVLMDLEEEFDTKVAQGKELYETTVRNWKIQRIVLQNQRNEEKERKERERESSKNGQRKEDVPTSTSGVDEKDKSEPNETRRPEPEGDVENVKDKDENEDDHEDKSSDKQVEVHAGEEQKVAKKKNKKKKNQGSNNQ